LKKTALKALVVAILSLSIFIGVEAPSEEALFASANDKYCKLKAPTDHLPERINELIAKTSLLYGCEKVKSLKKIEIYYDETLPRAMAGGRILKLRYDLETKPETEEVLIHEFAHIVDLGYFRGHSYSGKSEFRDGSVVIFNDDLSLEFYRISWQDSKKLKEDASEFDFVSGYAMSDVFEDFAESTLYYVKHNKEFRILAENNPILQKKYDFIKENIFDGKIFESGKNYVSLDERFYDATKIM
jgi:hypothetical protein